MSMPPEDKSPDEEPDDAEHAFRQFERLARKIVNVPKPEIDKERDAEKSDND
jgi:hypothetical protein